MKALPEGSCPTCCFTKSSPARGSMRLLDDVQFILGSLTSVQLGHAVGDGLGARLDRERDVIVSVIPHLCMMSGTHFSRGCKSEIRQISLT